MYGRVCGLDSALRRQAGRVDRGQINARHCVVAANYTSASVALAVVLSAVEASTG